jgi:carbonic anhydrase/acetyltransferase-like protein (isoleucine patch superfamily)
MSGLIVPFKGFVPKIAPSAFIAPNAALIGEVEVGANCSIWFSTVLRGDGPGIVVGENSNLQDGTVVHVAARGLRATIGRNVTVGHMALLHACEIQDESFIGMKSAILDGAVVESGAMVAAGAVVTPGKVVRRGELWAGNPAQKLRDLTEKDYKTFRWVIAHYVELARAHRGEPNVVEDTGPAPTIELLAAK